MWFYLNHNFGQLWSRLRILWESLNLRAGGMNFKQGPRASEHAKGGLITPFPPPPSPPPLNLPILLDTSGYFLWSLLKYSPTMDCIKSKLMCCGCGCVKHWMFRAISTLSFATAKGLHSKCQLNNSSRCLTYPHQLSVDKISLTHYTNTGPDWFLQGLAFIGRFQIDPDHKCTCTLQTYLKRLTQLNTTKGPVTFCLSATRLSTEVNWMKIN